VLIRLLVTASLVAATSVVITREMMRDDEGESGFICLAADEGEGKENEWSSSCRDCGGGANQKKVSVQL